MNLESLLVQISGINKKYEEFDKFSGEKFNIFNLLDLDSDELSHSKIIETLLNPKGMHGKDNKFLKLFLKCIGINDFSIDNVTTETEKFIGRISDDYSSGGRIDIALTNSEKMQIFIENKIYAGDQLNQLSRYKKCNPKHLLYLTLLGKDPGENSIEKDKTDCIKTISYKEHILEWLELCRIESIDNPLLRETLTQYIVLVKQLTGQPRSKKMQKEFLDTILKDADNVSAAFIISQSFNDIKKQILEEKFLPLMEDLRKKHGFDLDISLDSCFDCYWGFSFKKPEWKKLKINFEFGSNLQNLIYGVYGTNVSQDLDKYLRNQNDYKSTKGWPLFQYMDPPYRNWGREVYTELCSNSSNIVNVFENKINEISSIVENQGYEL